MEEKIIMDIITASEAKELSEKGYDNAVEMAATKIDTAIKESSNVGCFYITYEGRMYPEVKKQLEDKGYTVQQSEHTLNYDISW